MSIKSPIVSVIIMASNKSQYLLETIDSVRQQSFTDFEVLICYSGKSPSLVRWSEAQSDRRLRLLLKNDLDTIQTLNLGIEQAKGKYIALLKADDLWHSDKLQKQILLLEHDSTIGLIHSWSSEIDERAKPTGRIIKNQACGWVESDILKRNQVDFSSAVIRQPCFDMVGVFDPSLKTSFDWDMWIRLSRCYQFMSIAEPLVYRRKLQDEVEDSWLDAEKAVQATIEKAYQNIPDSLLPLKAQSYSYASLDLAWQVLSNQNRDRAIAYHYCRQALEHYPLISFSREFLWLSIAITTMYWLYRPQEDKNTAKPRTAKPHRYAKRYFSGHYQKIYPVGQAHD